jgi:hypothetical protein
LQLDKRCGVAVYLMIVYILIIKSFKMPNLTNVE